VKKKKRGPTKTKEWFWPGRPSTKDKGAHPSLFTLAKDFYQLFLKHTKPKRGGRLQSPLKGKTRGKGDPLARKRRRKKIDETRPMKLVGDRKPTSSPRQIRGVWTLA